MTEPDNRYGTRSILFAGLAAMAFAVTLAMVVGHHLRGQALAVLVGMAGGMGATVFVIVLISVVGRWYDERGDYPSVVEVSGVVSEDGGPTRPLPLSQIPLPTDAEAVLAEDEYRRGYRDGWIQAAGAMSDLMANHQLTLQAAYGVCWRHWEITLLPWTLDDCSQVVLPPAERGSR